jgi:hypothetical protein
VWQLTEVTDTSIFVLDFGVLTIERETVYSVPPVFVENVCSSTGRSPSPGSSRTRSAIRW